jgi:hypothetical protein
MDSIPFDNIKDGAIVRCAVIDGVQYLSICDLIMVMCEKDRNQAEQVWKQIKFKSKGELHSLNYHFPNRFPGCRRCEEPVIQFQGAMKLLTLLTGENQASDLLTRALMEAALPQTLELALPQTLELALPQTLELDMLEADLYTKRVNTQARLMEMYATLCPDNQLDDRTRLHFKDIIVNLSSAAARVK